jgi:hypothetical protein
MCLIIALIFLLLAVVFFNEQSYINASINALIALFFIVLLIRNIVKTKKERK